MAKQRIKRPNMMNVNSVKLMERVENKPSLYTSGQLSLVAVNQRSPVYPGLKDEYVE